MQHRRLMIPAALVGAAGIALAPAFAEAATVSQSAATHSSVSSSLSASTAKAITAAMEKAGKHFSSPASNSVRVRKANVASATAGPNPGLAIEVDGYDFSAFGVEADVTVTGLTSGTVTITVDWGDGQTSTTTVTADDDGQPVPLDHTYASLGTYTVTTTATDGQGDTVTNTASGVETGGAEYTPYGPVRILDTRKAIGTSTATPVAANNTLKLQVTGAGTAGDKIPAGIAAVVLNVTVVSPTANGFLTVYGDQDSAGDPLDNPGTSNINFKANQNVPNLVVVPVGANGVVDFANSSSGKTQILADVAGYFTPANTDKFVAISPKRILDTRKGIGATKAAIPAGDSITLTVAGAGSGAIPASGVAAVSMNLTAVSGTKNGVVTAYPSGQSLPTVSNLNYSANQTIANMSIVPVGTDGKVVIHNNSSGTVQVLADVNGYYSSSTTVTTASAYYPLFEPFRIIDTRKPDSPLVGPLPTGDPIDVPFAGSTYETSEVFNATVVQGTGNGFLSLYPYNPSSPSAIPTTSNLNYLANQTVPNLAIAPLGTTMNTKYDSYDLGIYLGGSGTAQLILDWFGEFDDNQSS